MNRRSILKLCAALFGSAAVASQAEAVQAAAEVWPDRVHCDFVEHYSAEGSLVSKWMHVSNTLDGDIYVRLHTPTKIVKGPTPTIVRIPAGQSSAFNLQHEGTWVEFAGHLGHEKI